jgi:hypothetical protein
MLEVGARDHRALPGGDIRGDSVWAYAELLEALALASQWEPAIRQADANADRFARAVRLRAQDVLNAKRRTTWPAPLAEAATLLADLATPQPARDAAALLARVALPVRQTELFQPSSQTRAQPESYERGSGPPPAALVIEHRGEPIMRPTPLTPGAMHQLEIEARLATWPDNAEELAVDFLTVHPPEYLYVGPVTFHPDRLRQPLEIRIAGERPPDAPPLQVTARASLRSGGQTAPSPAGRQHHPRAGHLRPRDGHPPQPADSSPTPDADDGRTAQRDPRPAQPGPGRPTSVGRRRTPLRTHRLERPPRRGVGPGRRSLVPAEAGVLPARRPPHRSPAPGTYSPGRRDHRPVVGQHRP